MVSMSKQKKPTGGKHKPRRMVGIPEQLAVALERVGESSLSNVTDVVKAACIEYLEKRGMWPIPKPQS